MFANVMFLILLFVCTYLFIIYMSNFVFSAVDVIKHVLSCRACRGLCCSLGGGIHIVTSHGQIQSNTWHVRGDGAFGFLGCLYYTRSISLYVRGRNSVLHAVRGVHVLYNRIFSDFFVGTFYVACWAHWPTRQYGEFKSFIPEV